MTEETTTVDVNSERIHDILTRHSDDFGALIEQQNKAWVALLEKLQAEDQITGEEAAALMIRYTVSDAASVCEVYGIDKADFAQLLFDWDTIKVGVGAAND